MQQRCGATGKLRFTKEQAHKFLAAYGRGKGSARSYACPFCDGYHTTKGVRGKGGKG